jgi:hypothetical protein
MESAPDIAFLNLDLAGLDGVAPSPEVVWRVKKAGAEAIERILTAVGKKPPGLDREALRADIGQAYVSRRNGFDLFRGSEASGRLKRLRDMRGALKKAATLMKADRRADAMIQWALKRDWPVPKPFSPLLGPSEPQAVLPFLERLQVAIAEIEKQQKSIAEKYRNAHKRDPNLKGRRLTEQEWLAGVELPLVFERHFRLRAGRSRGKSGSGPPTGPMVEFISATMKELGFKYTKESIARAYNRRAPLRTERRHDDVLQRFLRQI